MSIINRKRHSSEFKAKVSLEAIRGDLALSELSCKYGVHSTLISKWKSEAGVRISPISRCVWQLSNTLGDDFCVEALKAALQRSKPEIFNTDQGSQFTGDNFTGTLLNAGVQISMDGNGRWMDNVMMRGCGEQLNTSTSIYRNSTAE